MIHHEPELTFHELERICGGTGVVDAYDQMGANIEIELGKLIAQCANGITDLQAQIANMPAPKAVPHRLR